MFKNSKEYFEEINNTNRLNVRDNFFTFNEYEKNFYFRLIEHLDYYVDNTHIDFIEEELFMMKRTYDIIKNIQNGKTINESNEMQMDVKEEFDKENVKNTIKLFITTINKSSSQKRTTSEARSTIEKIIMFLNQKKINQFDKDEVVGSLKEQNKYQNKPILEIDITPKHENIFCNNGYALFEYILNEYIKPKGTLGRFEDLSFYYRCLFDDKFIHQKPEPFRLWFIKEYFEEFSKIKTKNQAKSNQRNKDYSNALEWFKLQEH